MYKVIMMMFCKQQYFNSLLQSVHQCDLCIRMDGRKKVLSSENGSLDTKVLFIAEAPGRLGAECTGIPLYGDKSGDNFETLLSNIGWKRSDVFITNAILCNPQDSAGNNATPEKQEILNCNYYLKMTIELINPDVIVTIGAKALDALNLICPHKIALRSGVAKPYSWNGRTLFPLYHTGPRAMIHRSFIQQRADFIALSHVVHPREGLKTAKTAHSQGNELPKQVTPKLIDIIGTILNDLTRVSFFKMTKLLYLTDYCYYEKFGYTLSGGIYLRMQEGPWIPYLKDISKTYDGELFRTQFYNKKPFWISCGNAYSPQNLTQEEICFIQEMCQKYGDYSDAQIKTAVYLTSPMRYILKQEKQGRQMTKVPVLYQNKTVQDMDAVNGESSSK